MSDKLTELHPIKQGLKPHTASTSGAVVQQGTHRVISHSLTELHPIKQGLKHHTSLAALLRKHGLQSYIQ